MPNQELAAVLMPDGSISLEWEETNKKISRVRREYENEIYQRHLSDTESWLLFLGFSDPAASLSPSLHFWREFAADFAGRIIRHPEMESLRENLDLPFEKNHAERHLEQAPLMTGSDYLDRAFLTDTWQSMREEFKDRLVAHKGTVADFVRSLRPAAEPAGRIFFHLVENRKGGEPFAFLATYSTRSNEQGASKHVPLKYALQEYAGQQEKLLDLLGTVYRAADRSSIVRQILSSGEIFHPLAWSADRAFRFLTDIPVVEQSGVLCRIPDWWRGGTSRVRLDLSFGSVRPSQVGLDALVDFNPALFLEDTPLTPEEVNRLIASSEGLVLIKNKWVAVDAKRLQQTLDAYEHATRMASEEGIRLGEALRLRLHPEQLLGESATGADVGVSNGEWLASVIGKLTAPEGIEPVSPGKNFRAALRPYQQQGVNWLHFLHRMGLGGCLADDMGLGKTAQTLALLNCLRTDHDAGSERPASLLVVPASLLANWSAEIEAFAPALRYLILHPGFHKGKDIGRIRDEGLTDADLAITTYALAARHDWLRKHPWFYLILDEAQAIKNPGTKQTKTLKRFTAEHRLILTGTPIENRLSDLWSLFDFINPGLLGTATEFKRFTKNLEDDRAGYARLRRLARPYILRRLKTDKTIISDLPDKVEMKVYAPLSKAQAVLYERLVDDIRTTVAEKDGMERKGLILSALTRFKQLCNHPDQYLGTGGYAETDSGKFTRLREICETIHEKREKLLIFTQFREITEPLSRFLASVFGREGAIIHGGVPAGKRKAIIDAFQSDARMPFLLLSLKAGGVGLNLTAANHVIHFDRWWNPAVEDQATDRAFRIGQQKKVIVHKFIARGTVEEKIDRMLEDKRKLSEDVIPGAGEKWITEMDNDELLSLFSLSL